MSVAALTRSNLSGSDMFEWLVDPNAWASLVALSAMEIVLGIDNVVFISLLVGRLEGRRRLMARRVGLLLALVFRIIMLSGIAWFMHFTKPAFVVLDQPISWRDVILIAGGLFLIVKATREIHHDIEEADEPEVAPLTGTLFSAILQIGLIDIVFSIDSIITAVGMAEHLTIMILAVMFAILVMYVASEPVARFIERHPTTKMLALSFLFLIGAALIADGLNFHIPRGYIYSAMAFAACVEVVNVVAQRRRRARRGKSPR